MGFRGNRAMLLASVAGLGILIATEGRAQEASAPPSASPNSAGGAAEVIVTAEKHRERLLDTPIPVSVVAAAPLTATNQSRLQDYYAQIPGLTMTDMVGGTSAVVIRGITTGGFGNPTVGTTVDDAPVGFSTGTGGGYQAIDLDPADLQRIEVLRGPQGTLYGASSMGGVIKYVTTDPSTAGFSGRIEASVEGVENGDGLGDTIRGSVNAPVLDNLAISLSGYSSYDEGFINDASRDLKGVNHGYSYGGRFAALWRPTDNFSLKLNLIHQYGYKAASDDVAGPDVDALQTGVTYLPGASGYKQEITFFDAVAQWQLGKVSLTSVTGYESSRDRLYLNLYALSAVANADFGVTGVPYVYDTQGTKFSQEVRASIPIGDRVTWQVGGFYTLERSSTLEDVMAGNFTTGAVTGTLLASRYPTTYQEFAEFTNATVKITDQADIQVGARESEISQTYSDVKTGPLAGARPITPKTDNSADAFTFLVTPEYKFSPDMMAYVRVASGYRAGGPNFNASSFGLPNSFKPDTTLNYDVGMKGVAFDHMLSYDLSLYYIDWSDIQIREVNGGFASVTNAGGAKSEGVELSLTLTPGRGLTLSGWAAYDDAVLTSALPAASTAKAYAGERLPYSSPWSGNVSANQTFPITGAVDGYIGGAIDFIGDRLSDFTPSNVRTLLPAYIRADLNAGVEFNRWKVELFANNITDVRGIIAQAYDSPDFHIIKPRTIGVDVSAKF